MAIGVSPLASVGRETRAWAGCSEKRGVEGTTDWWSWAVRLRTFQI